MITPFKTTASQITAQPTGYPLLLRSSSTADTQNITLGGTASETLALAGHLEVKTANSFYALTGAVLASAGAGTVTILGPGSAGVGWGILTTNPADGHWVDLGLTGHLRRYTFKTSPFAFQEVLIGATAVDTALAWVDAINDTYPSFIVDCKAGSAITQSSAFIVTCGTYDWDSHRFWFNVGGGGSAGVFTGTQHEVAIASTDTAAQVATKLAAVMVTDGWSASLAASAQVKIAPGIEYPITLDDDVAHPILSAVTRSSVDPFVTASSAGDSVLQLSDALACARQLTWAFAQSDTDAVLVNPVGGINGATLVTFVPGVTSRGAALTLDDETLTLARLGAGMFFTSDWIKLNGKKCSLYLAAGGTIGTALPVNYQVSVDGASPITGGVSITSLTAGRVTVNASENAIEYIRLSISNPNAGAVSVSAKACWG